MKFNYPLLSFIWLKIKEWMQIPVIQVSLTFDHTEVESEIEDVPISPQSKLTSFSYLDLIKFWITDSDNVVALLNINLTAKDLSFWANVPRESVRHFLKDIVILHCKDESQVKELTLKVGKNFADAYGFSKGVLIINNTEDYVE